MTDARTTMGSAAMGGTNSQTALIQRLLAPSQKIYWGRAQVNQNEGTVTYQGFMLNQGKMEDVALTFRDDNRNGKLDLGNAMAGQKPEQYALKVYSGFNDGRWDPGDQFLGLRNWEDGSCEGSTQPMFELYQTGQDNQANALAAGTFTQDAMTQLLNKMSPVIA